MVTDPPAPSLAATVVPVDPGVGELLEGLRGHGQEELRGDDAAWKQGELALPASLPPAGVVPASASGGD